MTVVNKRADFEIGSYEGLIHATARRFEDKALRRGVEFDDFVQILRIRVWKAIEAYDPRRSTMTLRRFVFGTMTNQVKDVLKKKQRGEVYIADLVPRREHLAPANQGYDNSHNALRFLSISEDQAFAELEVIEVKLPDTLSEDEHTVAVMLIDDYTVTEIAAAMTLRVGQVRAHVAAMRLKMGVGKRPLLSERSELAV